MALILTSNGVGVPPTVTNTLNKYGPAKVGRWGYGDCIPDRCKACPLDDVKPATGYATMKDGCHLGYCELHKGIVRRMARRG